MKKIKVINLSERQIEMLQMLQNETGITNMTAVIFLAINDLFKSYFPAYKSAISGSSDNIKEKIKLKTKRKELETEIKKETEQNERANICINDFMGKVIDGDCHYISYGITKEQDTNEVIPLDSCNIDVAENTLFVPSKEVVLARRKDLRKKFS